MHYLIVYIFIIHIINLLIVRKQKEEDKEAYENAEKLWLDQRSEIENELKETKSKLEQSETSNCISYDGVNNLNTILLRSLNYVNDIFTILYLMK